MITSKDEPQQLIVTNAVEFEVSVFVRRYRRDDFFSSLLASPLMMPVALIAP